MCAFNVASLCGGYDIVVCGFCWCRSSNKKRNRLQERVSTYAPMERRSIVQRISAQHTVQSSDATSRRDPDVSRTYLRPDDRLEIDLVHSPEQLRVEVLQGEEGVLVFLAVSRRLRLLASRAKWSAVQGAGAGDGAGAAGENFLSREVAQACQADRRVGGGLV